MEGRKCPYSNVPDMYNMCQYAHSEEELDEWRERYEWRQMKREMARQEKVFSFMDELLEQYQSAEHGIKVVGILKSLNKYQYPLNLALYLSTFCVLKNCILVHVWFEHNIGAFPRLQKICQM